MSASTWLVPLNVHHSLSLRTVAKNSRQLQNISTYMHQLTNSLESLERYALNIAGSTSKILSLLESKKHKEATIAAMRMLIFRHNQTCLEAKNEEDKLTAIASCILSEKLLNQDWFKLELFSHASFDEMAKADEILRNCSNIIDDMRTQLSQDEGLMIKELPDLLIKIEEFEKFESNNIQKVFLINKRLGEKMEDFSIASGGISAMVYSFGKFEIKKWSFWKEKKIGEVIVDCGLVKYREEYSDYILQTKAEFGRFKSEENFDEYLASKLARMGLKKHNFPRLIDHRPVTSYNIEKNVFTYGDEQHLLEIGSQNFIERLVFDSSHKSHLLEVEEKYRYYSDDYKKAQRLIDCFDYYETEIEKIKLNQNIKKKEMESFYNDFDQVFKGRLTIENNIN